MWTNMITSIDVMMSLVNSDANHAANCYGMIVEDCFNRQRASVSQ